MAKSDDEDTLVREPSPPRTAGMSGERDTLVKDASSPRIPTTGGDPDTLDRGPSSPRTPTMGSSAMGPLPAGEPGEAPVEKKRQELQERRQELEGALRYMGSGHPDRERYQQQLEMISRMLDQIDEAMARHH